jgi:hypothetical protein
MFGLRREVLEQDADPKAPTEIDKVTTEDISRVAGDLIDTGTEPRSDRPVRRPGPVREALA